nr:hypothetical protein [uncultured Psychrobacter sp.]
MFIRTLKYMMVGRTTMASGVTAKVNAIEGKELVAKGYAVEVDKLDKEDVDANAEKLTKAELAKIAKDEKEAKAKADAEAEERAIAAEEAKAKKTDTKK